jgi:hypothetical protein
MKKKNCKKRKALHENNFICSCSFSFYKKKSFVREGKREIRAQKQQQHVYTKHTMTVYFGISEPNQYKGE